MSFSEKKNYYSCQFNYSIKVFMSLYQFHQNISNSDKGEVILIDKVWFSRYKQFYLYDKIYELIKENNLFDFDLTEQKIIYNNLFKEFSETKLNKDIVLFYDEEFPDLINQRNDIGKKIKFINNFEIINQETYQNLINSMGMFKYCERKAKVYKYQIKDGKIIIKYENEKEKCLNLLIGSIGDKTEIYIPEILINFPSINLLQDELKDFIESSEKKLKEYNEGSFNTNIITRIEKSSFESQNYDGDTKFFVHSQDKYPGFDTIVQNVNVKEKKIKIESIKKALVYYYLNNQKLISNKNKDRDIGSKGKCYCFLINKSWINKLKTFFYYNNLVPILDSILSNGKFKTHINEYGYNGILINDDLMKDLFNDSILNNFVNSLDSLVETKLIDDLRNINPFLIDFNYHEAEIKEKNYVKIYENFEIIIIEKNNFIDILFPLLNEKYNKYQFQKSKENYIFFLEDKKSENVLNVCNCYLNENNKEINVNLELIIKGKNIDETFNKIKSDSYINYILSLDFNDKLVANLNNSEGKAIILNNEKGGEICKKMEEKKKFKKLIFNFADFIDNIKMNSIKKNVYKENIIYLAPKQYIFKYVKKYNLDFHEINKIINKIELEDKKNLLNKYINENFKFPDKNEDLNNHNKEQIIYSTQAKNENKLYIIINNNNDKIFYYDEFFLLDMNIVKYLNIEYKKAFPELKYFVKEKYVFLFQRKGGKETNVNVGKINEENVFKLKFLIESMEDTNYILKILSNKTYEQFYFSSFMFKDNKDKFANFSPFFDDEFNIIGNGYKPIIGQNNFIFSCYNQMLINIIYLIIYFNFPKYDKMTFSKGNFYYLISAKWMNEYMEMYKFKKTKNYMKNNKNVNLSVIINKEQKNKKLLNKIICTLIGEMYEINEEYNKMNYCLENNPSEAELNWIQDYQSKNQLYFYNDFFLLDEEIYKTIFNIDERQLNVMKNKNNYCKCFYTEEYIIVYLNKCINQTEKIILEVGKLEEHKFNLIYLLVFNSEQDFASNRDNMNKIGYKNFFATLIFNQQNIVPLDSHNYSGIGGYIFKYSEEIINIDDDNNFIINNSINPQIQLEPQNIPSNLRDIFHKAPQIGLKNVGATCYMNATIQCFGQIEKFALYFAYHPHVNEVLEKYRRTDCLSESFKELIENLWPGINNKKLNPKYRSKNANNEYYIPEKFKKKISVMNPLFQGAQANDSKDLVNFIVMQLHEELNTGTKLNNNQDLLQTDEMSIYNNFAQTNAQENKSIISDLFYGINGTVYECSRCKTKKFNFQIGFFYIFPLEEVRQYKIRQNQQQYEVYINNCMRNNMVDYLTAQNMLQMNNNQLQNISSVTLYDCFEYNQKLEYMMGENAMHCNICQKTENCVYQSYITNPPEIMIIILNRGQGIQYRVKCDFVEFLNIGPYVRYSNNTPYNYGLIGVVTHMGESGASGHFVAFCRSPIDNQWYNYNDDLCFPVQDLKREVIDYAMPYILFYQKM